MENMNTAIIKVKARLSSLALTAFSLICSPYHAATHSPHSQTTSTTPRHADRMADAATPSETTLPALQRPRLPRKVRKQNARGGLSTMSNSITRELGRRLARPTAHHSQVRQRRGLARPGSPRWRTRHPPHTRFHQGYTQTGSTDKWRIAFAKSTRRGTSEHPVLVAERGAEHSLCV